MAIEKEAPGVGSKLEWYQALLKHQGELILPPESELPDAEQYLFERYQADAAGWKRKLFYTLKPVIPRPIQLYMRRKYLRVQESRKFPAWPIEPILVKGVQSY